MLLLGSFLDSSEIAQQSILLEQQQKQLCSQDSKAGQGEEQVGHDAQSSVVSVRLSSEVKYDAKVGEVVAETDGGGGGALVGHRAVAVGGGAGGPGARLWAPPSAGSLLQ